MRDKEFGNSKSERFEKKFKYIGQVRKKKKDVSID